MRHRRPRPCCAWRSRSRQRSPACTAAPGAATAVRCCATSRRRCRRRSEPHSAPCRRRDGAKGGSEQVHRPAVSLSRSLPTLCWSTPRGRYVVRGRDCCRPWARSGLTLSARLQDCSHIRRTACPMTGVRGAA